MYRLVPALVAPDGRGLPRARPRPAADRGDAALRGDPLPGRRSTAACGCSTTSSPACPTARALPGEAAFRLYDTFGFPLDLTQDALREQGRAVDVAGFEAAMAEQKAKARAAWAGSGEAADEAIWFDLAERHGADRVPRLRHRGRRGPDPRAGRRRRTPVEAAEVGDDGAGRAEPDAVLRRVRRPGRRHRHAPHRPRAASTITDVRKKAGLFVHYGRVEEGDARPRRRRASWRSTTTAARAIRANHSATHLLHEALRRALGDHVAQRGSLVAPDRLRFDFTHAKAMTPEELAAVEAEVNAYVRQNTPVETRIMTPDDAEELGARALFGEKYGDEVRVVSMGARPGSGIGAGRRRPIRSSSAAAPMSRAPATSAPSSWSSRAPPPSGVRRIEALTGAGALAHVAAEEAALAEAAALLRARPEELARPRPRAARRAQGAGERDRRAAPPAGDGRRRRPRRRGRRPSPASRSSRRRSPASRARTCAG